MVGLPQHIAAIFVWPLHPSDLYHVGLVIHLFSPWIFVGDQFWALLPAPMVKLSVRLKFHFFLAPWTAKITLPRTSNSRVGEGIRSVEHAVWFSQFGLVLPH